jgi:hypothetical protein
MVYRGSRPRETKSLGVMRALSTPSTQSAKMRRHRNKKRIWRRAIKRLQAAVRYDEVRTLDIRATDPLTA